MEGVREVIEIFWLVGNYILKVEYEGFKSLSTKGLKVVGIVKVKV